jgi:hypothetical protein
MVSEKLTCKCHMANDFDLPHELLSNAHNTEACS